MRGRAPGFVAALAAVLVASLVSPSPSPAASASAERVAQLARQAARDPGALRELRAVDRVDGRPAAMRAALRGARGAELRRRLELLHPARRAAGARSSRARADAREILAERRFRVSEGPRPLAGPLEQLGTAVEGVLEWIGDLLPGDGEAPPPPEREDAPAGAAPGLSFDGRIALVLIALPITALALVVLVRLTRRRGRAVERPRRTADAPEEEPLTPPEELERVAEEAERAGDLARALRLRFRAGLLRLEAARAIELRPSLTSGELRRRLRSTTFEELSRTFDAVAYGGREAASPEVAAARRDWPRVLEEARSA